MWSKIASLVDDFNFDDDEEYDDSYSVVDDASSSLNNDLQKTKEELNK